MKGRQTLKLLAVLSSVGLAACSVVGIRETEEPAFTVIGHAGPAELRHYGPRIAAETTVSADEIGARSAGFRRLAGYIFGGNTSKAQIAMTAPVAQASETIAMTAPVATAKAADGAWVIRFFMPAGTTLETLPTPKDPAVRLVPVPGETVAALRFTGSTSPAAVREQQDALLKALSGSGWTSAGTVNAWFYDPPWTLPFLRRNEAVVTVTKT